MDLPLKVDFSGKVVVVTGAGGVLCGDKAASAITGVVLPIDAGFSAYSGV